MADRRSQKALSEFLSEAQETIEGLAKELLRLESVRPGEEPDPLVVNGVFRGAHSLKGLASLFGVERMAALAHALEDLLHEMRMGRRPLDAATLDLLLEAPDLLNRILAEEAQGAGAATAEAAESLARRLRTAVAPGPAAADALAAYDIGPEVLSVLTEYEEHRLRASASRGASLYRVRAAFDLATFDRGLARLNEALRPLGEVISTLPSAGAGDPGTLSFEVLFGSREPLARVAAAAGAGGATLQEVPRRSGPAPAPPAAAAGAEAARPPAGAAAEPHPSDGPDPSLRSVSQAVRVDIRKLDRLMNTVGELVLVKTNLFRVAEMARSVGAALGLELHRETRALERRLDDLQAGLLEVRMVPLSQLFDKLARLVRKISREVDKDVDFQVSGGEVELDKLIVEELSDPLMHLIRNAIDHGLESPEERRRAGKPPAGRVALAARPKGNHVEIAVEDDGAGIDEERIRRVAVERGLAAAEVRQLGRRELLNLIFLPGFSTAREVTPLSGRGVGMDVVKNNIGALSGIIELRTEKGRGTRFELTLPVTLAILRALVVKTSGRTYAVPLNSVLEILALAPGEIRTIEAREVLTLRGSTLPLVRLGSFLEIPATAPPPALDWPPGKVFVVVVGLAQERLGIAVDDIAGQQDILVKPLGPALGGVRGIAGATDLGGRQTVLVLDVAAIIEDVLRGEPLREAAG